MHLQQLQKQQVQHALLDPCDSNFQSRELWHNTTSVETQILAENWREKGKERRCKHQTTQAKEIEIEKSVQISNLREPSNSTTKTWKWLVKFSQLWDL